MPLSYLILDWLEKVVQLYIWILLGRVVLSWFQVSWQDQPFSTLYALTEPVLAPFQRLIPPIGGAIDISPMVVFFLLQILQGLLSSVKYSMLGPV